MDVTVSRNKRSENPLKIVKNLRKGLFLLICKL